MILVTKNKVVAVPLAETERELRDMVCGWASQAGTVDSVGVDDLGRTADGWKITSTMAAYE